MRRPGCSSANGENTKYDGTEKGDDEFHLSANVLYFNRRYTQILADFKKREMKSDVRRRAFRRMAVKR
jgi:hypothetical protein